MMKRFIVHSERCKSCGYCIRECPKNVIVKSGKINSNGYEVVEVEEEKCIRCGTCYIVCPDLVFEILEDEGGDER